MPAFEKKLEVIANLAIIIAAGFLGYAVLRGQFAQPTSQTAAKAVSQLIQKATFLSLIVVVLLGGKLFAQGDVIRVRTDLTVISLTVNDRDGRYIAGLKMANFAVFENGEEQDLNFCEAVDAPFTVLFLFETSWPMRDYLKELVKAANTFTAQLRPDDSIAAASFDDDGNIHMLLEPKKRRDFSEFVDVVVSGKGGYYNSTTFDAVEKGLQFLKTIEGKKALIVFSDGEQFGRHASAKSNLRDAEEQEATIYTLQFGDYPKNDPTFSQVVVDPQIGPRRTWYPGIGKKEIGKLKTRVALYMSGLAERTGGHAYKIDKIDDLASTFRLIAQELGTTYRLGYSPKEVPKDGEKRTITVKVDLPNLAVRSRKEVVYKRADRDHR